MWLLRTSHKHINQDTLSEYLDGRLQGRPLEKVEQQLAECDACRQELTELQGMVAMMQQLPMAEPRRSFVMSAPPLEMTAPAQPRSNPFLRTPSWVYAGAASFAALALVVTISLDASRELDSQASPPPFAVTASAPAGTSGAMIESASIDEFASRAGGEAAPETADASADGDSAPMALAAAAPVAPPSGEPEAGGVSGFDSATKAETQDSSSSFAAAGAAPEELPAPETASGDGGASTTQNQATAKGLKIEEEPTETAVEAPALMMAEPEPDQFTETIDGGADVGSSNWWRVAEVAAGALAVVFLIGLVVRWRAGRRYLS